MGVSDGTLVGAPAVGLYEDKHEGAGNGKRLGSTVGKEFAIQEEVGMGEGEGRQEGVQVLGAMVG